MIQFVKTFTAIKKLTPSIALFAVGVMVGGASSNLLDKKCPTCANPSLEEIQTVLQSELSGLPKPSVINTSNGMEQFAHKLKQRGRINTVDVDILSEWNNVNVVITCDSFYIESLIEKSNH